MICGYCERETNENDKDLMPTIDHFIPLSKGGSRRSKYNHIYACSQCNRVKGNMMPEEFLNKIDRVIAHHDKSEYQKLYPIIKKNMIGYMQIKQPYKFRIKRHQL